MSWSNGISVVVPVYNEENGNIIETIEVINKTFGDNISVNYEIIVVNDGSTDCTMDILYSIKDVDFRLFSHVHNKGYGASIKTGIHQAIYDKIIITDADGTYPNHLMFDFYSKLVEEDLDMLVAQRPFSSLPKKTWLAKLLLNRLADYVTGQKIPDINSGMRVFKKSSFLPFMPIIPNGFSLTTTITLGMLLGGYDVKYIPIQYSDRKGKSKIKPIGDSLNFIKLIMKIGLYFAPLKIFMPLAIILLCIGVLWALISYSFGKLADLSSLIIIVSSFQLGAIAVLAELINHRTPNYYKKQGKVNESFVDQSTID